MVLSVFGPNGAMAQEEATAPLPAEVPTEPAPVPVVPAEVPTEIPPMPTAVPTAVPMPPTAVPVEPTAVIVLPTAVPAEPTAIPPTPAPTVVPTIAPTPTATAEPTLSPIPTPTQQPGVSFTAAATPACAIAPNQGGSVAHGNSIDYICTHSVAITGTDVKPSAIGADWTIRASVEGGWSVSLLPPVNDFGSETPQWTPAISSQAAFTFHQKDPVGSGTGSVSINQTAQIEFRLRVNRAVCSTDLQTIRIDHSVNVTVASQGASVTSKPIESQPLLVTPSLTAIPEPTISFDGTLTFGDVAVTAAGPETPVRQGAVSLTVSGLDDACGRHVVQAGASPMADAAGNVLEGSHLSVVSVNNESISDEACDLASGCDVIALTTGPDVASSQTIALGVELRMPEQPGPGSYGTSLNASLEPMSGD